MTAAWLSAMATRGTIRTADNGYFFSWATAASAAWNPILLWVPSQKGFVTEAPHRQSAIRGRPDVSILFPVGSESSTSPSTRYGPFGRTVIFTVMSILRGSRVPNNTTAAVDWAP